MENVGRTGRAGARTLTYNPLAQDFVPSAGWTEDSNGHYLLVDLPGFKKEDVKLQVDTSGNMTVSGERLIDNKHRRRFKQIFTTPPDSDIDKISGKFDGGLLYVTVPKTAKEETKQPVPEADQIHNDNINRNIAEENKQETGHPGEENVENKEDEKGSDHGDANQSENKEKRENDSRIDSFSEDFLRKWGKEPSQFQRAIRVLQRNKGIVITALLAFSLGVFVTRKFGSTGHGEAV